MFIFLSQPGGRCRSFTQAFPGKLQHPEFIPSSILSTLVFSSLQYRASHFNVSWVTRRAAPPPNFNARPGLVRAASSSLRSLRLYSKSFFF
jgi:hypothetical protein